MKLQRLVMWLLKNIDQHQKLIVNEFIETVGSFFPELGLRLEKIKKKKIVSLSPSGRQKKFDLDRAVAIVLGDDSDWDN